MWRERVTRVAREVGTEGKLGGQAQVSGVAGTWKDLTDNVNFMASNLTGQVRNIAEVATAVARGDLEAITNTFYLLRAHPSLDAEARSYAQLADQELARVSHITRQSLSFYREHQRAIRVSISDLLDDVFSLQERSLEMNRISLERCYTTTGELQGFPSELKQVFMNLVSNAIQAMPNGGRLRVRVSRTSSGDRGSIRICITDSGTGICAEDAKHVFEPFFTTKTAKGTGLGLWISRGIVQKHDGVLRFRSIFQAGSVATCFQMVLPTDQLF